MQPGMDEFINWANGVTTSPAADMLPQSFSPRGRNTTLVNIGQETAEVGARKGPQTGNPIPITGSPVVLGQYQLKRVDGSNTHLLVSDNGRLDKFNADHTTSAIDAAAFTAGTHFPNFTTVNNICIISNGIELKKTDGTTVWPVGITRPAAPTAVVAAGGSMSTGVWDVALTYFNSSTGEESSRSDFSSVTTTGGNLSITVSWSAPVDTQVDYVRVYLRKQSLGANVYLAVAGLTPAPNATWNGFPAGTTSTVVNVSDNVFSALTIVAPSTTSNNPPAVTLQYPVWHNSRLFLFDSSNAYYSNITDLDAHPESFNPEQVQPIGTADGDVIIGAVSMPSGVSGVPNRLYIFKKFAMWEIDGYDPSSWTVTRLFDYGAASNRAIVFAGGSLYWWANSSLGMMMLPSVGAQPIEIAKQLISASVKDDVLNTAALQTAVAAVDETNNMVVFALPGVGSAGRNNIIIPFNYQVKRFVADGWNPMDVASFALVTDITGARSLYIGGYSGQIFKWWQATNDGVPSGTTGAGTVTAAGASTLTDANATFSTVGGKLIERYVYHIPAVGDVQRRRITGNTSTVLTVTPVWGQALVVGDTYVVGAIDWQLDTPWGKGGAAFVKKRFEFLFLESTSEQAGAIINADVYTRDNLNQVKRTLVFSALPGGALWDAAVWDADTWESTQGLNPRKKIALTGKSYRIRLRQLQSDIQITLNKLAVQYSLLGTKT